MSSKWYMAEGDLDSMIHRQDADSGSVAGSMWFVFLREKINDSKLVTAYVPCEIQGEEQQSMGRFSLFFNHLLCCLLLRMDKSDLLEGFFLHHEPRDCISLLGARRPVWVIMEDLVFSANCNIHGSVFWLIHMWKTAKSTMKIPCENDSG